MMGVRKRNADFFHFNNKQNKNGNSGRLVFGCKKTVVR